MFGFFGLLSDAKYAGSCMTDLIAFTNVSRPEAKDFIDSYIPAIMECKKNKHKPIIAVSITCLLLLTCNNRIVNDSHVDVILKFARAMIMTNPDTKISHELIEALGKLSNNEVVKEIEKYS